MSLHERQPLQTIASFEPLGEKAGAYRPSPWRVTPSDAKTALLSVVNRGKMPMMDQATRERMDTLVSKGTAYQQRFEFIDGLTWPERARIASTIRWALSGTGIVS